MSTTGIRSWSLKVPQFRDLSHDLSNSDFSVARHSRRQLARLARKRTTVMGSNRAIPSFCTVVLIMSAPSSPPCGGAKETTDNRTLRRVFRSRNECVSTRSNPRAAQATLAARSSTGQRLAGHDSRPLHLKGYPEQCSGIRLFEVARQSRCRRDAHQRYERPPLTRSDAVSLAYLSTARQPDGKARA